MKETGIVRQVDELGRIVLPVELRRMMRIKPGTKIAFKLRDNVIVLKKCMSSCMFCEETIRLTEFNGEKICRKCLQELKFGK